MKQKDLAVLIDRTEVCFLKCWDTLAAIKHGKANDLGERIISFQPILAWALHDLECSYRSIRKEEKTLIARKQTLNATWFVKRMKSLARSRAMLQEALGIGRALGDCFAVFAYSNAPGLLNKHRRESHKPHMPGGDGETGELAFISSVQELHGHLVLYHGITNILRLGDLSFVDLQTFTPVAIGELKTLEVQGQKARVQVSLLTGNANTPLVKGLNSGCSTPPSEACDAPQLDQHARDRLDRQLNRFAKTLTPKKAIGSSFLSFEEAGNAPALERLLSNASEKPKVAICGKSLIIGCVRLRSQSLLARMRAGVKLDGKLDALRDAAASLVKQGSKHNALMISSLTYSGKTHVHNHEAGLPLFWLVTSPDLARDLYFGRIAAWTIYNPASLLDQIESLGFTITKSKDGQVRRIMKSSGKHIILRNLTFFIRLIQEGLYSEECVFGMIRKVVAEIESLPSATKPTLVQLDLLNPLGPDTPNRDPFAGDSGAVTEGASTPDSRM